MLYQTKILQDFVFPVIVRDVEDKIIIYEYHTVFITTPKPFNVILQRYHEAHIKKQFFVKIYHSNIAIPCEDGKFSVQLCDEHYNMF